MIPLSEQIVGRHIELRTPRPEDWPALQAILNDATTMAALAPYFKVARWTDELVRERYQRFAREQAAGTGVAYVIFDSRSGEVIGDAGFGALDAKLASADFGVILHRSAWRGPAARECLLLCLDHAFARLGLRTVTFKTEQSRVAGFCRRYGFTATAETDDGYLLFEIRAEQWPAIRPRFAR